jgi:hypothetical protein
MWQGAFGPARNSMTREKRGQVGSHLTWFTFVHIPLLIVTEWGGSLVKSNF